MNFADEAAIQKLREPVRVNNHRMVKKEVSAEFQPETQGF